jgi:predicted transcriptional regulator of viral defense system
MPSTHPDHILNSAHTRGMFRARGLQPLGIPRTVLARLVAQGALLHVGRGLSMLPDAEVTSHHSLALVAARVPGCVVSLLSALAFHGLTDELPAAAWIAISRGHRVPRVCSPRLELTWTAPEFLAMGVAHHRIEGVEVAVTDPARTVADCFRYRSRVGVAVTALRGHLARHRSGRDELWRMAGACRVQSGIRPYLESLS